VTTHEQRAAECCRRERLSAKHNAAWLAAEFADVERPLQKRIAELEAALTTLVHAVDDTPTGSINLVSREQWLGMGKSALSGSSGALRDMLVRAAKLAFNQSGMVEPEDDWAANGVADRILKGE